MPTAGCRAWWEPGQRAWHCLGSFTAGGPAASVCLQATVVCDLVLLYLDAKADFYWKEKFEEVRMGPWRGEVGVI